MLMKLLISDGKDAEKVLYSHQNYLYRLLTFEFYQSLQVKWSQKMGAEFARSDGAAH
jgi:hypothetical protein